MTTWLNRQPPDLYSLRPVHLKVIGASVDSQQLTVKLDNGRVGQVDFPTYLNHFIAIDSASQQLAHAREKLNGCTGNVWTAELRYTLFTAYRVWQIDCHRPEDSLYYYQIFHGTDLSGSLVKMGLLTFVIVPLIGGIWLLRVRRGLFGGVSEEDGEVEEGKKKPPLRKRLRSWKWWVFGDMDSEPLDQPLRMGKREIVVNAAFYLLFCCYPFAATWVNWRPLLLTEVRGVHGVVVRTSSQAPQIRMKLDTRQMLNLTIPQGYWLSKKPETGELESLGEHNAEIAGCHATAWYSEAHVYILERKHLQQIYCHDRPAGANYGEFVRFFEESKKLKLHSVMTFVLIPLFWWLYVVRYRRGCYTKQ